MAGMAVGDFLTAAAQVATGSLLGKQQAAMDLARQQHEQAETARQQAQLALEQRRMGWEERRDAGLDADRADARKMGLWQRQHGWEKEGVDTLEQEIGRVQGGMAGANSGQQAAMVAQLKGLYGQREAARGRMTPPPGVTGAMPDLGLGGAAGAVPGAAPAPAAPWNPGMVGPPPPAQGVSGGGAAPGAAAPAAGPAAPLKWRGIDIEPIYQPTSHYVHPYGMVHDAPTAEQVKDLHARIAARELALQKAVKLSPQQQAELGRLASLLGPLTNPEEMNLGENFLRKTEHYPIGHSAQETAATDREAKEKRLTVHQNRMDALHEALGLSLMQARTFDETHKKEIEAYNNGQLSLKRFIAMHGSWAQQQGVEQTKLNRAQRGAIARERLAAKGKGNPEDMLSGTEKMVVRDLYARNKAGVSDGMGNFIHNETPEQRAHNTARIWRIFEPHGIVPGSLGSESGGPSVTEKMVRDAYHSMGPLPAVGLGGVRKTGGVPVVGGGGGAVQGGSAAGYPPQAGGTGTAMPRLPPVDPAAIEAAKRAGYLGPTGGAGKPKPVAGAGKAPPSPAKPAGRNPYQQGDLRANVWEMHRRGMTRAQIMQIMGSDPGVRQHAGAVVDQLSAKPAGVTRPAPKRAAVAAPITAQSQARAVLPRGFRGWSPAGLTQVRQGLVPEPLRGMSKEVQQAAIDALGTAELRFGAQAITLPKQGGVRTAQDQQRLYAQRGRNPNPVAPPGASTHQYGMAMDVTLGQGSPAEQAQLAQLMEPRGWHWAGTADPVHFTYTGGKTAAAAPAAGKPRPKQSGFWDRLKRVGYEALLGREPPRQR